jgi:group I intron endonuclease
MQKVYIYEIWINKYYYHGQTINIERRMKEHIAKLKNNKHINKKMQYAYNKYETFEYQILLECNELSADIWEQTYIDENFGLSKYLNVSNIASKPPDHTGKKRSLETREKISAMSKERKHSDETKNKIRQARLGKSSSEETKKKLAENAMKKVEINNIIYSSIFEASKVLNKTSSTLSKYLKGTRKWPPGFKGSFVKENEV